MAYDVQVRQVEVQPVAAARGTVTSESVPGRLLELLDHVHAFLSRGAVASRGEDGRLGRNVFLYRGAPDRDLLASAEGLPVEVGVLVATPFADAGAVVCSETPAGLAATTVHVGPTSRSHRRTRRFADGVETTAIPSAA